MRKMLGAAWLGGLLIFATGAWAADVQSVQGNLSINKGDGFVPINGRVDAKAGDSVMVGPNGSAMVSYADGCQVNVEPGSVTTIAPISPCAAGSYAQDPNNPNNPNNNPLGPNNLLAPLVAGVAVGTAIGIGAYESSQKSNNSSPSSP